MRQKTKNDWNQGSNDKKKFFLGSVPKSPTQMGSLSAKNASKKFSRLGTFKHIAEMVSFVCQGVATLACTKDIICINNAQQIFDGKM